MLKLSSTVGMLTVTMGLAAIVYAQGAVHPPKRVATTSHTIKGKRFDFHHTPAPKTSRSNTTTT
jgi:hypothetical protein